MAQKRKNVFFPTRHIAHDDEQSDPLLATLAHQASVDPAIQLKSEKAFTVFKDASGAYRWVSRTTTAYRDRDGEILTTKALEDDAVRMQMTGDYGPLRYWHLGQPNPLDVAAPWGPGVDIGVCDYSIVIGRTSIESGTFKSAAMGQAFADSSDDYELSPGFFHPPDQPDASGSYTAIRRFERSVVPSAYGRASNLFTGMTTKDFVMDDATYKARTDAFLKDMNAKGVPPEVAAATLAGMQQADKSAAAQGIAYKSAAQEMTINGVTYVLKAGPPAGPDAENPPETMAEGGMEEAADMGGDGGGEYIGDMTPQEFWQQLQQYLAPVLKMQEMVKAIGDMTGEIKGMYTTKDAGTAARIAQLEQELATLKGDAPRITFAAEAAAALKSTGPSAPPDPSAPHIPDDPDRPWAGWTAAMFPKMYQNGD